MKAVRATINDRAYATRYAAKALTVPRRGEG